MLAFSVSRWGEFTLLPIFCLLSSIRYNISTAEYDGWDSAVNSGITKENNVLVFDGDDALKRRTISQLSDVYARFGFSKQEALEVRYRGTVIHNVCRSVC